MTAGKKEAGIGDGPQFPDDFEYEFPQRSLLFDDERILRNTS
jgi:hypothetical protein